MSTLSRKRSRVEDVPATTRKVPGVKRQRLAQEDRLSSMSDELLLRVLGNLSVHELAICQRVSKRLHRLAGDSQLWKFAYYATFVKPRARRLPGRPRHGALDASSKRAAWLNEQHLITSSGTDWQRQYKVRHNWSRGDCTVREVRTAERQPTPRSLVQSFESLVVTAEREHGLRVWRLDDTVPHLQCTYPWPDGLGQDVVPLAMAMSAKKPIDADLFVVVGLSNGTLFAFNISQAGRTVQRIFCDSLPETGKASALAVSHPFVAILTEDHVLYVYRLEEETEKEVAQVQKPLPILSLRSGGLWPPAALQMRVGASISVSVAYALPQYLAGWSIGLQELMIGRDGVVQRTRTAIADQVFTPLSRLEGIDSPRRSLTRPTALSLSHPYILTAHSDNILCVYMVRTTDLGLEVGRGHELWGHTSAVSAIHVGPRGKAVSVGTRGDEIRVWDLEGGSKHGTGWRGVDQASVQVRPSSTTPAPRLTTSDHVRSDDTARGGLSRDAHVGFDEERLWVLREVNGGSEALVVYDFS